MPLIVVLMLICVAAIIYLVGAHSVRPSETAELNKDVQQDEEQISAATTTVQAGQTYIIPKDGLYKIELHGGKSTGLYSSPGINGSKLTGYLKLRNGDSLVTEARRCEHGTTTSWLPNTLRSTVNFPGDGMVVSLNGAQMGYVSGGPGSSWCDYWSGRYIYYCTTCGHSWYSGGDGQYWNQTQIFDGLEGHEAVISKLSSAYSPESYLSCSQCKSSNIKYKALNTSLDGVFGAGGYSLEEAACGKHAPSEFTMVGLSDISFDIIRFYG